MDDSPNATFNAYVSQWWKAAFAPAWDAVGWIGFLVGLVLWVWRKWWPHNFGWAATQIGFSPDGAMSDLVWLVPATVGGLVLLYRLVRAPYEIHLRQTQSHMEAIAALNQRIDALAESAREFKIDVDIGGYYIATDPEKHGVWCLVYHGLVVTNQTEKPVPLELWLFTGDVNGSWKLGEAAGGAVPKWATDPVINHATPLERIVNLPGRHSVAGFCVARFGGPAHSDSDFQQIANTTPFWLEIRNNLTGESRLFPANFIARRIDHGLPGLQA